MPTDQKTTELWQRLAATPDLPESLREDAASALATLVRAGHLRAERHKAHLRMIADHHAAERDSAATLMAQLSASKKQTLDSIAASIDALRQGRDHAQLAEAIATRAELMANAALSARLLRQHRHTLLEWVARRRAIEPTATGLTEHVTADVREIWQRLGILFYPLPTELELPADLSRVPVIFSPSIPTHHLRALAWIWEQIAAGHYTFTPPPRNPSAPPDRLRITSVVLSLPAA